MKRGSHLYYCNQSVEILKYMNLMKYLMFVNYKAHYDLHGYTRLLNS